MYGRRSKHSSLRHALGEEGARTWLAETSNLHGAVLVNGTYRSRHPPDSVSLSIRYLHYRHPSVGVCSLQSWLLVFSIYLPLLRLPFALDAFYCQFLSVCPAYRLGSVGSTWSSTCRRIQWFAVIGRSCRDLDLVLAGCIR